jgi:type II secretory pathway pseudopilin PulG
VGSFIRAKGYQSVATVIGIRVHTKGAIITPHVSRSPLKLGAIIVVDVDVDVDQSSPATPSWIWELHDTHNGTGTRNTNTIHNVTLDTPGDMLLLESDTIVHGAPYPLEGQMYATVEVYFGDPQQQHQQQQHQHQQQQHQQQQQSQAQRARNAALQQYTNARSQAHAARGKGLALTSANTIGTVVDASEASSQNPPPLPLPVPVPAFLPDGTKESKLWRHQRPPAALISIPDSNSGSDSASASSKTMTVHRAAALGNVQLLKEFVKQANGARSILQTTDSNGWQPLHEAARSGDVASIVYLIEIGNVPVNVRTNRGKGGNALYLAVKSNGPNHASVKVLEEYGAIMQTPDLE